MSRLSRIARMQLTPWYLTVGLGWGIVLCSLLVNLLISNQTNDSEQSTGGLLSLYVFVLVQFLLAITQFFPFTLGLSVTRKAFYGATALLAVVQTLAFGIAIYLLSLIEATTNGWGSSLSFFRVGPPQDNPLMQVLSYAAPMLLMAFIGVFCGVIIKRWGPNGMFVLGIAVAGLSGLVIFFGNVFDLWGSIGAWFGAQNPVSLLIGLSMLLAVVLAGSGMLILRRAAP